MTFGSDYIAVDHRRPYCANVRNSFVTFSGSWPRTVGPLWKVLWSKWAIKELIRVKRTPKEHSSVELCNRNWIKMIHKFSTADCFTLDRWLVFNARSTAKVISGRMSHWKLAFVCNIIIVVLSVQIIEVLGEHTQFKTLWSYLWLNMHILSWYEWQLKV